jgi:pyrrolidone-carboxylate peptidase
MRVLITSFGPFAKFNVNPSNAVMLLLKKQLKSEELLHSIEYETIEVSYSEVDLFLEKIKKKSYDFIIHLGVATNDTMIRLETRGRNERSGADVLGVAPVKSVIMEKSVDLHTNFSKDIIVKFIETHPGLVRTSDDAGTFLCNYIYFNSLQLYRNQSNVLFIHIADYLNNADAINATMQAEILSDFIKELLV